MKDNNTGKAVLVEAALQWHDGRWWWRWQRTPKNDKSNTTINNSTIHQMYIKRERERTRMVRRWKTTTDGKAVLVEAAWQNINSDLFNKHQTQQSDTTDATIMFNKMNTHHINQEQVKWDVCKKYHRQKRELTWSGGFGKWENENNELFYNGYLLWKHVVVKPRSNLPSSYVCLPGGIKIWILINLLGK